MVIVKLYVIVLYLDVEVKGLQHRPTQNAKTLNPRFRIIYTFKFEPSVVKRMSPTGL